MRGVKLVLGWFLIVLFFAATTAGLWLPPVISHAVEKDYRFTEVAIDATVEPNGDLLLEERRTFDFRNGPFTYAYFNVDDPQDHVRDFTMAELLDDGTERPVTPDSADHSIITDGFQAQWSYSAEDEERTWIFRYRVACAAAVYTDTAHLYWQFIGTGWDKSTSQAVIAVHLPDRFDVQEARPRRCDPDDRPELPAGATGTPLERSEVRAFGHGPLNGSVTIEDPQTIVYDVHDVPPASFVEASILFPTGAVPLGVERPVAKRSEILAQERAWALQANALRERHEAQRRWVFILMIAVPLALALLVWVAKLRDRVSDVPDLVEQPPEDDSVPAALLWSAWRGSVSPQNAYRAQIMRLARLGAIEIQAEGLVTDPKDLTLVRKMGALDLPNAEDQDFMWLLFGRGTTERASISLKEMKKVHGSSKRYRDWYDSAKTKTGSILRRVEKGDSRFESVSAFAIAIGASGYGLWTAAFGLGGPIGWWLIPVSVIALIVALRIIPARLDEEDRRRVMKLAAFRKYLKDFSDLPNAPALAVVIWEEYLEWAVALDVAHEVEKQVTALVPVESLRSPIPGGPSGAAGIEAFHGFQTAAATIVLTSIGSSGGSSSSAFGSSSSSSGFSSGGFSSGGGGGGGATGGGAG